MFYLSYIYSEEFKETPYYIENVINNSPEKVLLNAVLHMIENKFLNNVETLYIKLNLEEFKTVALTSSSLSVILKQLFSKDKINNMYYQIKNNRKIELDNIKKDYFGNEEITNKLDDYEIINKLGNGAFGEVSLAINKKTRTRVAIKKMKILDNTEIGEYNKLLKLKDKCNKYFICVYNYIQDGQFLYIIMQYLEDFAPLSNYMGLIKKEFDKKSKIENYILFNINKIINNMCKAISELQKRSIIHNDLKPDNIMANFESGEIRFIDFGISCEGDNCSINPGIISSGTPLYMDPYAYKKTMIEYRKLTPNERAKGDLWAFGIIIYQMVIGYTPMEYFSNTNDNQVILNYLSTYTFESDLNKNKIIESLSFLKYPPNIESLLNSNIHERRLVCI